MDYIERHPTIAPAEDFSLTDADYAEFKQRVLKSGFTYDPESEKVMKRLKQMMEFEGYMEDAKPEFEALEKKLAHNLDKDLDRHKALIMQLLQNDIVAAYYYQAGSIANTLQYDKPKNCCLIASVIIRCFNLNLNVDDNDDDNDYLTEHKDTKALSFCFYDEVRVFFV